MFWFAADPRLEFDGTSLAHSQHASTRLAALGSALALLAIMAAFAPDPTKAEGAIAIGRVMPKQWVGISINEPTLQAAQDKAISRCNEQGRNCGIATTFRNTCIAIMWVDRIIPAGYTYTIRASLDDARQTAMSNCRAQRAVRCELLFSGCDTVDEAALASAKRRAEEQAAEEAKQKAIRYEQAARDAEQRLAAIQNSIHDQSIGTLGGARIVTDVLRLKKMLALALTLMAAIFVAIIKNGYPKLAGLTAIAMPCISLFVYMIFGVDVKDEITLAQWPLYTPFAGGALVVALTWKIG